MGGGGGGGGYMSQALQATWSMLRATWWWIFPHRLIKQIKAISPTTLTRQTRDGTEAGCQPCAKLSTNTPHRQQAIGHGSSATSTSPESSPLLAVNVSRFSSEVRGCYLHQHQHDGRLLSSSTWWSVAIFINIITIVGSCLHQHDGPDCKMVKHKTLILEDAPCIRFPYIIRQHTGKFSKHRRQQRVMWSR